MALVRSKLYNIILRIARNFLEARENIKILTHPLYHINFYSFSLIFLTKKIKMADSKKTEIFKIANSQYFFVKISWSSPWVSKIHWCEGHWYGSTYMAVRLSDVSSKMAKKHKKCIFGLFLILCRIASQPYRLSHTNALCINEFY